MANEKNTQTQTDNLIELYDVSAEEAVLSWLLSDPSLVAIATELTADDFTSYQRADIFAAILTGDPWLNLTNDLYPLAMSLVMDAISGELTAGDLAHNANLVVAARNERRNGNAATCIIERSFGAVDDPLPAWALKPATISQPVTSSRQLLAEYAAQKHGDIATSDLARDFLGTEATMVAPARSHFDGDYPGEPDQKTCQTKWVNDLYEYKSNPGKGHVKAHGARFAVLHDYMTKSGLLIKACPHCLHKKTIEKCQHIERASEQYTRDNLMRYALVSDEEAKRISALVKKRNQRNEDGITLSVVKVPQVNGKTYILHDVPDIDGDPLPSDRADLYDLVVGMVTNSAKGRRGWRGLVTWGMAAGAVKENKTGAKLKEDGDLKFVARLMGENFGKHATFLRGYLDIDDPITRRKGINFDVDVSHYLQQLDNAGLDYAVVEGDLSHLRQKKKKEYCAKRDNAPIQPGLCQPTREIVDDIPGF